MRKIPKFVWVLIVLVAGLLGIKQCMAGDVLRYKVTVTVTTPEGEKTGYAVREAGRETEMRILPQQGGVFYNVVKGEAVVVDLGKRGVLFSIMSGQDEAEFIFKTFAGKDQKNKAVLAPVKYPYVGTFTFTDLSDPKTVKGVEYKNLAKSFGEGVALKEVTVEITGEPVTTGINKYLPSYGPETGFMEWFRDLHYGDPRRIGPWAFKIGEK